MVEISAAKGGLERIGRDHIDDNPKDVGAVRRELPPLRNTKRPVKERAVAAKQKIGNGKERHHTDLEKMAGNGKPLVRITMNLG